MKKLFTKTVLATAAVMTACAAEAQYNTPVSQMEKLGRAPVALPAQQGGQYISWRVLGTDPKDLTFSVVRDGKVIASGLKTSNYTDPQGTATSSYRIIDGSDTTEAVKPWADLYKSIPINRPDSAMAGGRQYKYTPGDCSAGDVDGDGEYEIILKWDPTMNHDNAHDGYTGNVIFDCYKLDGTQLWRINLGKNIRAGAHYTQFLVYDFDKDGKAEMICKTAPGSIDGTGAFVSIAGTDKEILTTDNNADYVNSAGRILSGEEFLTVFDGETGKAVHTIWYTPNRAFGTGGKAEYSPEWGDENGNRGERFLACAAYLDGPDKKPSAVMCRGYYTQSYLWAVDYDNKKLTTKWLHASVSPSEWILTDADGKEVRHETGLKATAFSQGAHSVAVGDVDGDGKDEITYGSAAIDHDGSLLYSTGLGHGDALHLGDLDPERPGLEVFMAHEHRPYGADLRDARTGEILWRCTDREDTGRALTADIDANNRGSEMWSSAEKAIYNVKGEKIADERPAVNFRIYWDGDLQDEILGNGGGARGGFGKMGKMMNDPAMRDSMMRMAQNGQMPPFGEMQGDPRQRPEFGDSAFNNREPRGEMRQGPGGDRRDMRRGDRRGRRQGPPMGGQWGGMRMPMAAAPSIQKWNGQKMEEITFSNGKKMSEMGNSVTCNGTKATPCLQADIIGDWREELIVYDSSDCAHLNIFTTNIPTEYRIPTLMHDHIYRMCIVWQNVTYNQPPHVGYYMGDVVNEK